MLAEKYYRRKKTNKNALEKLKSIFEGATCP